MHRMIDYLLRLGKQNRVRGAQRSYVIRLLSFFPLVVALQTVPSSIPSTAVHLLSFSSTTYTCSVSNATGATATRTFTPANATPNDATDDFTAIQTAINHASNAGGGIVTLPAGTFLTNGHLQMKSNVKLQGSGQQTIIKAGPKFLSTKGPYGGYPVITTARAQNVTIANLTADQSGDRLNGNVSGRLTEYLVDLHGSTNVVVDRVSTRNPFTYSIVASAGTTKFCINNSSTQATSVGKYNQLDGIHVLDSNTGDVINNTVDQRIGEDGDDGLVAHTIRGPVHDVRYAGNKVRGGHRGHGMQIAVGNFSIYRIKLLDNEFWGSPFGIRTGYYDNGTGDVDHITISKNYIHDLKPGHAFPERGNAIDIGFGNRRSSTITNTSITNNLVCNAGVIKLAPGQGNVMSNNTVRQQCS
jgi:hypothetical protein